MVHCLTKNLPPRFVHMAAIRNSWMDSLLTKLAGATMHRSLPLAIAPQGFPGDGLVFSAFLVGVCGFAAVDIFRESIAATPGRYRHCSVQDWPGAKRRPAPILPQRGPCGCAASPASVFSAPARGTRPRALLSQWRHSSPQATYPLYTVLPKRRGEGRIGGMIQRERNRHSRG